MAILLAIIGILVGIAVGIAAGFCFTYSGINKNNTIGSEANPELPPKPKTPIGTRIMTTVIGLLFFVGGAVMLYFGATHLGLSGSELASALGPGTTVSSGVSGGTFVAVGFFAAFIGSLLCVAGIMDK